MPFYRLESMIFSDCCTGGESGVVYDSDEDIVYCRECWGERMLADHPDFIVKEGFKNAFV